MNRTKKASLIRTVKAGQRQLNLDDVTYRSMLKTITCKDSATKCNESELQRVIDAMRENGFKPSKNKHGRRPKVSEGKKAVLSKIEALLADAHRSWTYAESMCKRMFEVDAIDRLTLTQLKKLMQALIIDAKRRNGDGT
jgi:phage gp16-like protein